MAVTGVEAAALLAARLLFGGVIAVMGLNHFRQAETMAGYARHEGVPAPTPSVLASGAVLVLGGAAIVLGAFPVLGAVGVAAFLVVSALLVHDFWADDGEARQAEMTQFLKNLVMAGGALAIGAVGTQGWALSAGVGLF